jgi:hypothetical protein
MKGHRCPAPAARGSRERGQTRRSRWRCATWGGGRGGRGGLFCDVLEKLRRRVARVRHGRALQRRRRRAATRWRETKCACQLVRRGIREARRPRAARCCPLLQEGPGRGGGTPRHVQLQSLSKRATGRKLQQQEGSCSNRKEAAATGRKLQQQEGSCSNRQQDANAHGQGNAARAALDETHRGGA